MQTRLILLLLLSFLSQSIAIQAQNTLTLNSINWSSTDQYVAVILNDLSNGESIVRIYDTETQSLIKTFYNTTGIIISLAWSPDDTRLVINDGMSNSYIRKALDDDIIASFGGGTPELVPQIVNSTWNYDGTLLANIYDFGNRFDIRNGLTGELLPDMTSNLSDQDGYIWHDTATQIALRKDNQITILDTTSGERINSFTVNNAVTFVHWHDDVLYTMNRPTDMNIITEHQYIVEAWDTRTGMLLSEFYLGQFGTFRRLNVVGETPHLAVIRNDNTVQIRNIMNGSLEQSQQFERDQRITFSPNSNRYVIASSTGVFEIRSLPLSGERLEITPSNSIVYFRDNHLPTLSYVDEAPIDYSTDYFGYLHVGSDSFQDNLPHLDISTDFDWLTYHVENDSSGYDIYEELYRYGRGSILLQSGGWNLFPVFSNALWKEDTEIAFWKSNDNVSFELAILNPRRELTQTISMPREPYLQAVTWSANSSERLIIFSMQSENGDFDLYQLDLDTESITPFLEHPANDHSPQWSPSGTELLFVSDRNSIEEIFVFSQTDGTIRQITEGISPQWSPTGDRIAFERNGNIYIINADGIDEILFVEDAITPRWLR